MSRVEDILMKYRDQLMALPGVFGVAVGRTDEGECIEIHADHVTDALRQRAPVTLEGVTVRLREMGRPHLT